MFFFRILLLTVFVMGVGVPARAAQYVDDDGVYSFTLPDEWALRKLTQPMPVVTFGPAAKKGAVMCHSMKMPSESARGAQQAEIVDSLVTSKINEVAIKSADDASGSFVTSKTDITGGMAVRTAYETTGELDGVQRQMKVVMVLAHNTHTGHTVDINCRATEDEWNAGAAKLFENIQASMTMHRKGTAQDVPLKGAVKTAPAAPNMMAGKDKELEAIIDAVRKNITSGRLKDGSNVPAETPAELVQPIIPLDDARRVVNRGILTAMAEYCGFAWEERSYMPFMQGERASGRWSDKQMAFIGMLHGYMQASILQGVQNKGSCSAEQRRNVEKMLGG